MEFLPSDDLDLVFFFSGEAHTAMGARSAMGPQLEAAQRSKLRNCDGNRSMKKPKADRRVILSDDALLDEQIDAAKRARQIGGRIALLDSETRTILALHYEAADTMGSAGVSLALCSATQTALVGYHRFIERAKRTARPRFPGPLDAVVALSCPLREREDTLEQSIQGWIRWLATRKAAKPAAGSVLEAIIDEAKAALGRAQTAYAQAKGQKAA